MLSIKIDDKEYELSCTFAVMHAIEKELKTSIPAYASAHVNESGVDISVMDMYNIINIATDKQIDKKILENHVIGNTQKCLNVCINQLSFYIDPQGTKERLEEDSKKKGNSQNTPA